MTHEPQYTWDAKNGVAICVLTDTKGKVFTGEAVCHIEDHDMMSEKTGCEIAYRRALITYFKDIRDNEIKPAIAALKEYYYTIKHSKKYNPKSYENVMLQRKIQEKENDLVVIKEMINEQLQGLKNYINAKESAYQAIRRNRAIKDLFIDTSDKSVGEVLEAIGTQWPHLTREQQIKIANNIIIGQK